MTVTLNRRRHAARRSRADDLAELHVLAVLDDPKQGRSVVMRQFGLTSGQIAGMRHRTIIASDKIPCRCEKPENRDGGMTPGWWRA